MWKRHPRTWNRPTPNCAPIFDLKDEELEEHITNIEIAESDLIKSFEAKELALLALRLAPRNPALSVEELIHQAELLLLAAEKAQKTRSQRAHQSRVFLQNFNVEVVQNVVDANPDVRMTLKNFLKKEVGLNSRKQQKDFLLFLLDPQTNFDLDEDQVPPSQELLDSMLDAPVPKDRVFEMEYILHVREVHKKVTSAKTAKNLKNSGTDADPAGED